MPIQSSTSLTLNKNWIEDRAFYLAAKIQEMLKTNQLETALDFSKELHEHICNLRRLK